MQNKNITDITMDGSFLAPYSHEFKYIRNRNRNGADKKKKKQHKWYRARTSDGYSCEDGPQAKKQRWMGLFGL